MHGTIIDYLRSQCRISTELGIIDVGFEEWINSMSNLDFPITLDEALDHLSFFPRKDDD
jgi:hypothetical protein